MGHAVVTVYRLKHDGGKKGVTHVIAWQTPSGRKRKKVAAEEAAMSEARLKASQLNAGKLEAADMSASDRDELAAARELASSTPLLSALKEWKEARSLCAGNLIGAVRFYAEHFKNAERKQILVKDAVAAFMKVKTDEGIQIATSYGRVLPRLRDGELGYVSLESVGREQLADWINRAFAVEGAARAHPETFNTARRRFVTMWKWARDEGYLPKLAKTAAEEIKTRKDHPDAHAAIGIMTVEDWRRSLDLIREKEIALLATLVVAGFCGLRRSELMAQKWSDIDLKRGHLRVTKAKPRTPARRLVPISPAARRWLAICPKDGETIGKSWASDHVRARLKEAGISCPDNALRHSFISYRCAETGSVDRTAQDAGNSSKIVFQHYRELVTPKQGKEWFGISP